MRLVVRAEDDASAERAWAEAWDAGARGGEERGSGRARTLLVYAPEDRAAAVREALAGAGLPIVAEEAVEPRDWSGAWRASHRTVVVSARLAVRPEFVSFRAAPGQGVVVVEPGQAFGTGAHASTRLALECLAALPARRLRGARVLDVGTGSGVLALAALRLGAACAVGCDLDARALAEARANAARNGLSERLALLRGGPDALGAGRFDLVLANLLRRGLEPLLPALAARTRPSGHLVLSGLLAEERRLLAAPLAAAGLAVVASRRAPDPSGGRWLALLSRRAGARASPRAGGRG